MKKLLVGSLALGFVFTLVTYSINYVNAQEIIASPLEQLRSGVLHTDVKCINNLQLIFRSSNNLPVCVRPDTATKLDERGWGTMKISNISKPNSKAVSLLISPDKKVYAVGEQISITVRNVGTERLTLPNSVRGIEIRNPDNVGTCCLALAVVTQLEPNQAFTYNWIITDWNNDPPKTGNYTIFAPLARPLVILVDKE